MRLKLFSMIRKKFYSTENRKINQFKQIKFFSLFIKKRTGVSGFVRRVGHRYRIDSILVHSERRLNNVCFSENRVKIRLMSRSFQ